MQESIFMNNKLIAITLIISILFIGCTHVHTVGYGPQAGTKVTSRQFYLLYGLVPLNSVDTNKMAGIDSNGNYITDYEIQTQTGLIDIALAFGLGLFTYGLGPVIIQSRTVTVTQ